MNAKSNIPRAENHPNVAAGILKRAATVVIFSVMITAIFFFAAGTLNWIWAWVYLGIAFVTVLINGTIMLRTSPETVAERGEGKLTETWDKVVSGLWAFATYLALPLVAGLDERFSWSRDLGVAWNIAGAAVLAVGLGFSSWAMIANAYFSTVVRIQSERGHTVCSAGPYQFVRHPGYVGFILQAISVPFLLGSLWALIPGITAAVLMIIRTSFEDRMLQAELAGYKEYVQRVHYRLVPGVW